MKKILTVLLALSVISCGSDDDNDNITEGRKEYNQRMVIGNWVAYERAFVDSPSKTYTPDADTLIIRTDGTYSERYYQCKGLPSNGTYKVDENDLVLSGTFYFYLNVDEHSMSLRSYGYGSGNTITRYKRIH